MCTGSPFISNTRIFRHASEDITVNGIMIPKGLRVLIPIIVLHHSKEFWENPEVFRPERYMSHISKACLCTFSFDCTPFSFTFEEKMKHPQLCHMPFGWGPRNCIGMRFALMEARMALAAILKDYKFVQTPDTEVSRNQPF